MTTTRRYRCTHPPIVIARRPQADDASADATKWRQAIYAEPPVAPAFGLPRALRALAMTRGGEVHPEPLTPPAAALSAIGKGEGEGAEWPPLRPSPRPAAGPRPGVPG